MKSISTILITAAVVLLLNAPAMATHHLIRAGEDWSALALRAKPGDEILLMPGRHLPAVLKNMRGTEANPIIIRGLDPDDPPTIEADRYGIRLRDPLHVRIENITITGARVYGIYIEGAAAATPGPATGTPGFVEIDRCTVERTGPRGDRHGIVVEGVHDVNIVSSRIVGWAGSAIEIIGSRTVTIDDCELEGDARHEQLSGIRARGGSEDIRITNCRIVDYGEQGIALGGKSDLDRFQIDEQVATEPGSLYEVRNVRVARCVIKGGQVPLAFVHCQDVEITHCTLLDPNRAILSVRIEQTDPRFTETKDCRLSENLITWNPSVLKRLDHTSGDADPAAITMAENLWWAPGSEAPTTIPGTLQFPQVTDLDPGLDPLGKPTVAAAEIFGAYSD